MTKMNYPWDYNPWPLKRGPEMNKRDFELIAKVLRCNGSPLVLCVSMANALKDQHPNFNRERFLEACKQEVK